MNACPHGIDYTDPSTRGCLADHGYVRANPEGLLVKVRSPDAPPKALNLHFPHADTCAMWTEDPPHCTCTPAPSDANECEWCRSFDEVYACAHCNRNDLPDAMEADHE